MDILQVGPMLNTFGEENGQGWGLYLKLSRLGFNIRCISRVRNRVLRFFHVLMNILVFLPSSKILLVHSFAGRAFVLEDLITGFGKLFNKKIIFRIHGGAFLDFYLNNKSWSSRVLKRSTMVCTPSKFLQESIRGEGFPIIHLPNFLNLDGFQYNRENFRSHSLLWVRAFQKYYDPLLAIRTLEVLKKQYPDVTLTMVGYDQGLMSQCVEYIKLKELTNHITLAGRISNNKLPSYYQSHEVFLTTTMYESFGVATFEAAACGIPCVCVPVGEIPYIWQNRQNIIFADRDPLDFALKVTELFENKALADKISKHARINAENYVWDKIKPQWEEIIDQLIKN